jgi:hypothetical protein
MPGLEKVFKRFGGYGFAAVVNIQANGIRITADCYLNRLPSITVLKAIAN